MMAPKPASRAVRASLRASSGVRWALSILASTGIPSSRSVSMAALTTSKSLSLPMMTATFFAMLSPPEKYVKATAQP